MDDLGERERCVCVRACVWSLADIEVHSAQTEVCDCKKIGIIKAATITKNKVISVNQLHYKTSEKSRATEELVGYSLSCKLQHFLGAFWRAELSGLSKSLTKERVIIKIIIIIIIKIMGRNITLW
jgi:hypothetical protein